MRELAADGAAVRPSKVAVLMKRLRRVSPASWNGSKARSRGEAVLVVMDIIARKA